LKPERWGSLLVQENNQEEKACDKRRIIIIIIIVLYTNTVLSAGFVNVIILWAFGWKLSKLLP
jgi:flagellar basal body-associated protein FliL